MVFSQHSGDIYNGTTKRYICSSTKYQRVTLDNSFNHWLSTINVYDSLHMKLPKIIQKLIADIMQSQYRTIEEVSKYINVQKQIKKPRQLWFLCTGFCSIIVCLLKLHMMNVKWGNIWLAALKDITPFPREHVESNASDKVYNTENILYTVFATWSTVVHQWFSALNARSGSIQYAFQWQKGSSLTRNWCGFVTYVKSDGCLNIQFEDSQHSIWSVHAALIELCVCIRTAKMYFFTFCVPQQTFSDAVMNYIILHGWWMNGMRR